MEKKAKAFFEMFLEEKLQDEILNSLKYSEVSLEEKEDAFFETVQSLWASVKKGKNYITQLKTEAEFKNYMLKCVHNRMKQQLKDKKKEHKKQERTYELGKIKENDSIKIAVRRSLNLPDNSALSRIENLILEIKKEMKYVSQAQEKILQQCIEIIEFTLEDTQTFLKGGCHFNVKQIGIKLGISRPAVDIRLEKLETLEEG